MVTVLADGGSRDLCEMVFFFFFNDTATTEIYTLSLHDALPINPLDEAGLRRFRNPQTARGLLKGTDLADEFLQIRLSGDQALFAALARLTVEAGAVDEEFVSAYCSEYDDYRAHLERLDWDTVLAATGLSR